MLRFIEHFSIKGKTVGTIAPTDGSPNSDLGSLVFALGKA